MVSDYIFKVAHDSVSVDWAAWGVRFFCDLRCCGRLRVSNLFVLRLPCSSAWTKLCNVLCKIESCRSFLWYQCFNCYLWNKLLFPLRNFQALKWMLLFFFILQYYQYNIAMRKYCLLNSKEYFPPQIFLYLNIDLELCDGCINGLDVLVLWCLTYQSVGILVYQCEWFVHKL